MVRQREVIVVAPSDIGIRISASGPCRTRLFTSLDELLRWLDGGEAVPGDLRSCVNESLLSLGCEPSQLATDLLGTLEWLSLQRRVPPLKVFAQATSSRRTFFRRWASLPEPPSLFLERVRLLHAQKLLKAGLAIADVVDEADYGSITALLGALQRQEPSLQASSSSILSDLDGLV